MGTYRISQLAERSGVPASTLRFYETAGLLPAERTPSGYRVYDDEAVQRLAFISSAKLLGLALDEIGDLLTVWERGVCAAVRERMLPLVAARIADADRRAAELSAFSARLAMFHTELAEPAPAGGCGPDCGCLTTTPTAKPGPVPLTLTSGQPDIPADDQAWQTAPVACTLSSGEQTERAAQWHQLLQEADSREEITDGLRLTFPSGPDLAARIAALAAAEQDCCAFFAFTLHLTPTGLVLTIRAPETATALLADLFGASA
ncbi:heavy metal-responsive transcriptional regulator [Parafrankia colletiae]|uniref:Heavy metal-responsive transcriptional regulator n=1 Tax=Parafrankia colletiae TaxID=573497 RepID=A0A1S1QTF8_9ACTN|nr:heavy metal-responsive transcriptional regulator [Parafrankia colletiae]MCK9899559.1 heavy metal-responsive transcriptional regulator [Frankia sp. Cpl3]OHV38003.1 heavy metal-responsive transcriptional regulator [Parafrankia colletiae]